MATVGVLVASGFEQTDMTLLCRGLAEAGHMIRIISTKKHAVRSWDNTRWNGDLPVDVAVIDADLAGLDGLVLPGGLMSADTLRADQAAVRLVAAAARQGMMVAALGHAGWVLIEAGLVRGRYATAHPAIRTDMVNAGGLWRDDPVVTDALLITGRHAHDAGAFVAAVLGSLHHQLDPHAGHDRLARG